MRNHSYENDFDLHEIETACRTLFHIKGFALRLVLKQRHKGNQNGLLRGTRFERRKENKDLLQATKLLDLL